jgi:hypothetical protein
VPRHGALGHAARRRGSLGHPIHASLVRAHYVRICPCTCPISHGEVPCSQEENEGEDIASASAAASATVADTPSHWRKIYERLVRFDAISGPHSTSLLLLLLLPLSLSAQRTHSPLALTHPLAHAQDEAKRSIEAEGIPPEAAAAAGEEEMTLDDAERAARILLMPPVRFLGDGNVSAAKSSLGDAKSLLGDVYR